MKRTLLPLVACIAIFSTTDVSAQGTGSSSAVRITEPGKITLWRNEPIYITKINPINAQIDLPVRFTGAFPGTDTTVPYRFTFNLDTTIVRTLQINPDDAVQTVSKATWDYVAGQIKKKNKMESYGYYTFPIRLASNGRADTTTGPERTFISIAGVSGTSQEIDLVNYDPGKPFWIEVGANFDLASQQIQTTNVFGGVFMYKKDLAPVFNGKGSNNLAIAAGVYESKNFSQNHTGAFKVQSYLDSTSYPSGHGPDSIGRVYTDSGTVKSTTQTRNIGLFFSPQVRLTNKDADEDGIHLFMSFYAEMLWQNVQVNYDYSMTRRIDTTWVGKPALGSYSGKTTTQEFDFYSHYEGFGLPIFFKEGTANLYLNPVIGVTNQPSTQYVTDLISNSQSQPNRQWKPFYLVQFRLCEDHYGISFSGEIRQLIGAKSDPYITLILSKKFDLSKLIEFAN